MKSEIISLRHKITDNNGKDLHFIIKIIKFCSSKYTSKSVEKLTTGWSVKILIWRRFFSPYKYSWIPLSSASLVTPPYVFVAQVSLLAFFQNTPLSLFFTAMLIERLIYIYLLHIVISQLSSLFSISFSFPIHWFLGWQRLSLGWLDNVKFHEHFSVFN